MKIVGCDLHTRYQQIAMLDKETGELIGASSGARERRSASFLRRAAGHRASGHRGHRAHALVRAHAGRVGARAVDRRCGADPGVGGAQAEDGRARCGALAGVAVERTLPAHLAADDGGARSAATGVASAEAGVDAQCGGQSTARPGHGRRRVPQEEAVHQERPRRVGRPEAGAWASYRRQELLTMLDQLDASLKKLDHAVAEQAEQNPAAVLLMTHPGWGR